MDNTSIPVNIPALGERERELLQQCIETGWISSEGPLVTQFEQSIAELTDRSYGVSCSSGTAALDIAVAALGLGPGDEVIMPTLTIISPALSLVRAGATPVLIDSDPVTWNMDVSQIEEKITSKTRAILVVHLYGLPVDMTPVLHLAARYGLRVIEDAAEMLGQSYRSQPCGSFGDISTFSFYANKHVTSGEGGMAVCHDEELAARMRSFRNLCFQPHRRFVHHQMGWNYRMTNLQAAVGLAQTERLHQSTLRKQALGKRYRKHLEHVPGIRLQPSHTGYAENIYWVFGIVLDPSIYPSADRIISLLGEHNIGSRPFFYPMHQQPVFRDRRLFLTDHHPVAKSLSEFGFYLPSGIGTTDDQIDRVCGVLKQILDREAGCG